MQSQRVISAATDAEVNVVAQSELNYYRVYAHEQKVIFYRGRYRHVEGRID